ncbi:MAG: hypothetical protein AAGE86_03510 [Pseudomonadota bacterium]
MRSQNIEQGLTRAAESFDRHERLITIIAAAWFWTGVAVYARFIELPDIPHWIRQSYFWGSVAANAIWWAALRPAIEKRRQSNEAAIAASSPQKGPDGDSGVAD